MTATADLLDEHPGAAVSTLPFRQFGGVTSFDGVIATVRCFEDNVLVKQRVSEPGEGELDVPVTIGGVTFRPGARVASDDDGLVVLDAVAG